jgi:energy-coupling factor transport system permease protein
MEPEYGSWLMVMCLACRRLHPITLGVIFMSWILSVYLQHDMFAQVVIFVELLVSVELQFRRLGLKLRRMLGWILPFLVLYTAFGTLLGPAQGRLIWQGPHIPMLGTLTLTAGGLTAALTNSLTLWNIFIFVMTFARMIRTEDVTYWIGSRFNRIALTLSMVMRFIPDLIVERDRIGEVMGIRGHLTAHSSLLRRMQAMATVYRILLMNGLERSFSLAESMYVRGYGSAHRTRYHKPAWRAQDVWSTVAAVIVICLSGYETHVFAHAKSLAHFVSVAVAALLLVLNVWLGGQSLE